jgi:hypothetical protein
LSKRKDQKNGWNKESDVLDEDPKKENFSDVTNSCVILYARSNEILGWGGVENRQLLCFFKA